MRDTAGRFTRSRIDQLVIEGGKVECVECQLQADIGEIVLCGNCSQAVHVNGLCAASCPFCKALICQLCVDTSPTGGWHVCVAVELAGVPS